MNQIQTYFRLRCLVHPVSSARMILSTVIATEDALGITELANIDINSISQKTFLCWRVYLQEISLETQL